MPPPTKTKISVHVETRRTTHLDIGDEVEFASPTDCTMYFTDKAVFGKKKVEITAGEPVLLTVVATGTTQFSALERGISAITKGSPTEIVVP